MCFFFMSQRTVDSHSHFSQCFCKACWRGDVHIAIIPRVKYSIFFLQQVGIDRGDIPDLSQVSRLLKHQSTVMCTAVPREGFISLMRSMVFPYSFLIFYCISGEFFNLITHAMNDELISYYGGPVCPLLYCNSCTVETPTRAWVMSDPWKLHLWRFLPSLQTDSLTLVI